MGYKFMFQHTFNDNSKYKNKYLKYKNKYLQLKNQLGSSSDVPEDWEKLTDEDLVVPTNKGYESDESESEETNSKPSVPVKPQPEKSIKKKLTKRQLIQKKQKELQERLSQEREKERIAEVERLDEIKKSQLGRQQEYKQYIQEKAKKERETWVAFEKEEIARKIKERKEMQQRQEANKLGIQYMKQQDDEKSVSSLDDEYKIDPETRAMINKHALKEDDTFSFVKKVKKDEKKDKEEKEDNKDKLTPTQEFYKRVEEIERKKEDEEKERIV